MRTGISLNPEEDFVLQVKNASRKFDFVEIQVGEMETPFEEIDREGLVDKLEERGFGLVVHLPFRQPLCTTVEKFNEAELEYMEELIEEASELGAEKAVVHVNMRHGEEREEVKGGIVEQMVELDRKGEEKDVEVCFENIPFEDSLVFDLMELGEILEQEELSMTFDTGHAVAEVGQEGTEEFLEKYSNVISHIHVQDARDGKDQHLSLGDGHIDFEGLTAGLQDFNGTASLEIFTSDREQIDLSRRKWERYFK